MRGGNPREREMGDFEMGEEFFVGGKVVKTDAIEVLTAEVAVALDAYAEHLPVLVGGVRAGSEVWEVGCEGDGMGSGGWVGYIEIYVTVGCSSWGLNVELACI